MQEEQRAAKAQAGGKATSKGGAAPKAGKETPGGSSPAPRPPKSMAKPPREQVASRVVQDAASDISARSTRRRTQKSQIFSHFGAPKHTPTAIKGNIHPAIVSLGAKFGAFKITGANARCIATMTAFQKVIQDYATPPGTMLSRHLTTHLSHQITYLVSSRPLSVSMGNAIRWLKVEISRSDVDLPEKDAKKELCDKIDTYVKEKIIVAAEVIQENATVKIKDGDVILTYARSSVVEKSLLHAKASGKNFSVVVADSRPLMEGKALLRVLSSHSIPCTYLLLPAIGSLITSISKVFVGAHSLHANGAVLSRAGTALVAMMAKEHSIPVLVCCETYKFSETVPLDSFTRNELAPLSIFKVEPDPTESDGLPPPRTLKATPGSLAGAEELLEVMDPLYDLTPPTAITAVVTEVGIIPPNSINSIPVALNRLGL